MTYHLCDVCERQYTPYSHADMLWFTSLFSASYYTKGACATDTSACTDICVNILKMGGNAVDAAIAATICIGTVSAQGSGIGGGGFATIENNRKQYFINFREMAPKLAHKDMYTDPLDAQRGPLSIATPGELKGLSEMHSKFGKLTWQHLFRPSIALANDGFKCTKHLAKVLSKVEPLILKDKGLSQIYTKLVHNNTQKVVVEEGDVIYRKNYAITLQLIAEYGVQEFYSGSIAVSLTQFLKQQGGILSFQDFNHYKTEWQTPLHLKLNNGLDLYTGVAPSGGPVLGAMLNIYQQFQSPDPTITVTTKQHRVVEVLKHAYARRSQLADPNFIANVTSLSKFLISNSFATHVYSRINDSTTYPPSYYNSSYEYYNDKGTTHLSVMDLQGNAVSLTSTVNLEFGSCLMDPVTGVILNDQMDDFSIPNRRNAFDLAPAAVNYIAAYKRPQSSAAPSILKYANNGNVKMVVGGSGGSRITSAVFKTIVDVLYDGKEINESVQSSRIHHQLFPNEIEIEQDLPMDVQTGLKLKGHELKSVPLTFSAVQGIVVKNGFMSGAADKRKHGTVGGY